MSLMVRTFASNTARWSAIGLGFSLPISVAVDNVLAVLAILAWLAAGDWTQRLRDIRRHPVAMAALVFAGVMLVGMVWSIRPPAEMKESMVETLRYLLLGMLVTLFVDERTRRRAVEAFLASSCLVLAISFLLWSSLITTIPGVKGSSTYPIAFKFHITHNVLMAIAAVLFVLRAMQARDCTRWVFAALAAAAVFNVLFMIPGRTGQLALVAALIYVCYGRFGSRGLLIGGTATAAIVALAWWVPNSVVQQRATLALEEASAWHPEQAQSMQSSVGLRLEFYRNSMEMFRERPLLGTGTGGFAIGYAQQVAGKGMVATDNPHNAFLLVGVELGILGLAALTWLLFVQWRTAPALPTTVDCLAARSLLVVYVVASMVSSTFNDHVEGLFFVWASALLWAPLRSERTS